MASVTITTTSDSGEPLVVTITSVGKDKATIAYKIGKAAGEKKNLVKVKANASGLVVTATVDIFLGNGPTLTCTLKPGTGPTKRSVALKVDGFLDIAPQVTDADYQALAKLIADTWVPKAPAKPPVKPGVMAAAPKAKPKAKKPTAKKPAKPKAKPAK